MSACGFATLMLAALCMLLKTMVPGVQASFEGRISFCSLRAYALAIGSCPCGLCKPRNRHPYRERDQCIGALHKYASVKPVVTCTACYIQDPDVAFFKRLDGLQPCEMTELNAGTYIFVVYGVAEVLDNRRLQWLRCTSFTSKLGIET